MSKIKQVLKKTFSSQKGIFSLLKWLYNRLPFNNKIKGKRGNRMQIAGVLKHCKITFLGKGNCILIEGSVILRHCSFIISGNNNKIVIQKNCRGKFAEFCMQDGNNTIVIGEGTSFAGKIHLACIEGTAISIGNDCLFSSEIVFRTGDSHVITDMTGKRTNPSRDITIGNHVWLGHRVLVTKGVSIADNCVIGTGAIVTKPFTEENVILGGCPAKIIKTGVDWHAER